MRRIWSPVILAIVLAAQTTGMSRVRAAQAGAPIARQFAARDFTVRSDDLELTLIQGSVFPVDGAGTNPSPDLLRSLDARVALRLGLCLGGSPRAARRPVAARGTGTRPARAA